MPGEETKSNNRQDFVRRAEAHLARDELHEAVKACRLGLLVDPTCLDGRLVLGRALLALSRADEALSEMRVALEMDDGSAEAHRLQGEALLQLQDIGEAHDALLRAHELESEDPLIHELLRECETQLAPSDGRRRSLAPNTRVYPASVSDGFDGEPRDTTDEQTNPDEETTLEETSSEHVESTTRERRPIAEEDVAHLSLFEGYEERLFRPIDEDFTTANWLPPPRTRPGPNPNIPHDVTLEQGDRATNSASAVDDLTTSWQTEPVARPHDTQRAKRSESVPSEARRGGEELPRRVDQQTAQLTGGERARSQSTEATSRPPHSPSLHFDPHASAVDTRPARRAATPSLVPANDTDATDDDRDDATDMAPDRGSSSSARAAWQVTTQLTAGNAEQRTGHDGADAARSTSSRPLPDYGDDIGQSEVAEFSERPILRDVMDPSEQHEVSEVSQSDIVTAHLGARSDTDDVLSDPRSIEPLASTVDEMNPQTAEISLSAIHILPDSMPPLPADSDAADRHLDASERHDDAEDGPHSGDPAAPPQEDPPLDVDEQTDDGMTKVRFEAPSEDRDVPVELDFDHPHFSSSPRDNQGARNASFDSTSSADRHESVSALEPPPVRPPPTDPALSIDDGGALDAPDPLRRDSLDRLGQQIERPYPVHPEERELESALPAHAADDLPPEDSLVEDILAASSGGRSPDGQARSVRRQSSASLGGSSLALADPYQAPPRTAALTEGDSADVQQAASSERYSGQSASLAESQWTSGGSYEQSVIGDSARSNAPVEHSQAAASVHRANAPPRLRRRRRRALVGRLAALLDTRRGHGKIVLASVCVGVIVLALGIGFIVRNLRHSTTAQRSRTTANHLLRQGNVSDYRRAAAIFREIARTSRTDASAALIFNLIQALIPFEFGVETDTATLSTEQQDANNALRAATDVVEALTRGKLEDAANLAFNARNLYPRSALLQYLQGRIELLRGKPTLAIEYLHRADQLQRDNALFVTALAEATLSVDDFEKAGRLYARALQINPNHVGALLGKARLHIERRSYDQARAVLDQLSEDPARQEASKGQQGWTRLLRARLHVSQGEMAYAQASLEEARESAPLQSPTFMNELAMLQLETSRFSEAEQTATRAASMMPGYPHPLLLKARIYLAQWRAQDAWEILQSDLVPSEMAHLLRAETLLALSQTSPARQQLAGVEAQQHLEAKLLEARILAHERSFEQAEAIVRELLGRHPDHSQALTLLAKLLLQKGGSTSEARQSLERAVAADESAIEARLALSDVLLAQGQYRTAHQHLISVTRRYASLHEGSMRLAELNFGRRDLAAARTNLKAIVRDNPHDQRAHVMLIRVQLAKRQPAKAEQHLLQLRGMAPGLHDLVEGRVALAKGDFARAISKLSAASQRLPHDARPLALLSRAYLLDGNTNDARRIVRGMRRRFGDTPAYQLAKGRLELARARQAVAIKAFAEAAALVRRTVRYPADEAEILVLLGRAHHENDEIREALSYYRKAATACPFCPRPRYRQGLALDEMNQPNEAIASLLHAARLNPRMLQVYYELGRIYARHDKPRQAATMYKKYLSLGPPEEFAEPVRHMLERLTR